MRYTEGMEQRYSTSNGPLPGILFDRETIRLMVENQRPTLYRLYNAEHELVYLGASNDARTRLLAHLRDGKPAIYVRLRFFRSTTAMAKAEKLALEEESTLLPAGFGRRHAAWRARAS